MLNGLTRQQDSTERSKADSFGSEPAPRDLALTIGHESSELGGQVGIDMGPETSGAVTLGRTKRPAASGRILREQRFESVLADKSDVRGAHVGRISRVRKFVYTGMPAPGTHVDAPTPACHAKRFAVRKTRSTGSMNWVTRRHPIGG